MLRACTSGKWERQAVVEQMFPDTVGRAEGGAGEAEGGAFGCSQGPDGESVG